MEKKCEKCSCSIANVQKTIIKLPNVLVLHIKRFTPDPERMTYDKNKGKVKTEDYFFLGMRFCCCTLFKLFICTFYR